MEARSLKYIAEASGGAIENGDERMLVQGVSTDSRKIVGGELFIAIRGEKYDGHNFAVESVRKGASAVMLQEPGLVREIIENSGGRAGVILVEDTRRALGRLAGRYRRDFEIPVVVVAGSNGKTTTKEMIAAVLGARFEVHRSQASFNNDIGVPLTLLGLEHRHQIAVLEAGTNHPGELKPLLEMIAPEYGVITSIGREHLGYFGSLDGVVEEEATVGEALKGSGKLFLNVDSPYSVEISRRSRAPVVRIGLGGTADWRALINKIAINSLEFKVCSPDCRYDGVYELNITGAHNVVNATIAIAIGAEFGVTKEEIARQLKTVKSPSMRMQIENWKGVVLINDAYNANPDSVTAAIKTLTQLPCNGRRVLVLGEMAELGEHTFNEHKKIGELAASSGIDWLLTVGEVAKSSAQSAMVSGLKNVDACACAEEAAEKLKVNCASGDVVLIKGSRVSRLERIIEFLRS